MVFLNPELGFAETKTSSLVSEKLDELGVVCETGIALTGVKGFFEGAFDGPTAAVIGEMDALPVLGHPHTDADTSLAHACGHHYQIAVMLGVAVTLPVPEVLDGLTGKVSMMAVPVEELIDVEYRLALREEGKIVFLFGKQELIRLGHFDDVDVALMIHTSASQDGSNFSVGETTNAHLAKYVHF